jgi:hypothetical protein
MVGDVMNVYAAIQPMHTYLEGSAIESAAAAEGVLIVEPDTI